MKVERYKMIFTTKINEELELEKLSNIFFGKKINNEILSDNIRILGHDFVKFNKNKAKLIINNKKNGLKEFINNNKLTNDKIKINILLSKDLSKVNNIFKNCIKLLEFSIYDDFFININDEESYTFEELFDDNIDYNKDKFGNIYDYIYKKFYNDNDNIYSNCSEIRKREERDSNYSNSTIIDIKDNIKIYQYNYYSNMSYMFYNCRSLSSLPDISKIEY